MFELRVEDVSEPTHRVVLKELLAGEFSYTASGEQIDSETFELQFGLGEYAVVMDELLERKQKRLVTEERDGRYRDVYDAFPKSVSVEEGDSFMILL